MSVPRNTAFTARFRRDIRQCGRPIGSLIMTEQQADAGQQADDSAEDVPEQMRVRREKYDRLIGDPQRAPFPVGVERTATLAEVRARYPDLAAGTETGDALGVTGRVIFIRNTGKLCFAMLREGDAELQVMLSLDRVGAESLSAWKSDVDLGDLVFVHGEVI
jgi:lysyl-tRNA synthetase class 2